MPSVFTALRAGIANPLTLKTYMARLQQAARDTKVACKGGDDEGEEEAMDRCVLALLRDPETYAPAMQRLYGRRSATTHKNMVTAVLAAFKHNEPLRRAEAAALLRWKEEHAQLCQAEEAKYDENRPLNERQVQRYVSFDEVELAYARLRAAPGAHATLRDSVELLLLTLVALLPPKRADLGAVRVYRTAAEADRAAGAEDNFAVVPASSGKRSYLVLRRFKTAAKQAEIMEDLPEDLSAVARASLAAHPRDWLLVDSRGRPFSNNAYSKFFARTFERLFDGRKAGPSLLRHAYISERIDFDAVSRAQRKDIAHRMGHSIEVQERMYKWVGGPIAQRPIAQRPTGQRPTGQVPAAVPVAVRGSQKCKCSCRCE
jgi:hypothetical protein